MSHIIIKAYSMKKVLLILLSLLSLHASDIDIGQSKGTEQEVIASLSPSKAQIDVWNNAKIEIGFDAPLDTTSIQKNNVKLVHLASKSNEHISGELVYNPADNQVIFTPASTLEEGTYEVEIKSLKTVKEAGIHIDEIKYRFYVPEVINGYQLPPEPDKKLNNSTLLGIDFNNNGVRDDVERLIIFEEAKNPYFPKTHTAISLQFAWAWQKMIENPVVESREYLENASACRQYFYNSKTEGLNFPDYLRWEREHHNVLGSKLQDQVFNTRERIEQRFKFNDACRGKVFNLKSALLEACKINIDELGE